MIDAAVNAGANQVYGPSLSTATRPSSTARPSRGGRQRPRERSGACCRSERLARSRHADRRGRRRSSPLPFAARQGDGRLDPDRARDAADDRERHGHLLGLVDFGAGALARACWSRGGRPRGGRRASARTTRRRRSRRRSDGCRERCAGRDRSDTGRRAGARAGAGRRCPSATASASAASRRPSSPR